MTTEDHQSIQEQIDRKARSEELLKAAGVRVPMYVGNDFALADLTDYISTLPSGAPTPVEDGDKERIALPFCPSNINRRLFRPYYEVTASVEHLRKDSHTIAQHIKNSSPNIAYHDRRAIITSMFSAVDSCDLMFERLLSLGNSYFNRSSPRIPVVGGLPPRCFSTIKKYKYKFEKIRSHSPELRLIRNKISAHSDLEISSEESRNLMIEVCGIDIVSISRFILDFYEYAYNLPVHAWESQDDDGIQRLHLQYGPIAGRTIARFVTSHGQNPPSVKVTFRSENYDEMLRSLMPEHMKSDIRIAYQDPFPSGIGTYNPIPDL